MSRPTTWPPSRGSPSAWRVGRTSGLGADGVTVMQSNGAAAWQTVFHYHVHVIPRYEGDPLVLPWRPGGKPATGAALERPLRRTGNGSKNPRSGSERSASVRGRREAGVESEVRFRRSLLART